MAMEEKRGGIEKTRPTYPVFASQLELWLHKLQIDYQDRILSITEEIAEFWGTISPNDPLPEPDGLIAATALHHGIKLLNPSENNLWISSILLAKTHLA
jgi:predicted nucleic acid-binding protein